MNRRMSFEVLESRQLLSITLPTIAAQTVAAGAPLNIALNGSPSNTNDAVTYSVSVSNSTLTTSGGAAATLTATIPTSNPSLKLTVSDTGDGISGTMTFQLFSDLAPKTVAAIESLVDDNYYANSAFHRIIEDFMIQGGSLNGDGTGGPSTKFDDEFNSSLQFTGPGILAMANSGADTNGSQFFITSDYSSTSTPYRSGDFRYAIFGFLTTGSSLLNQLDSVATTSSSATSPNKPLNTVAITSAQLFTDNQNGVLRLSAPNGTTGTADVTVTATDSVTGDTTSQTFHVTVASDTVNDPPYITGSIGPINTTANTPVPFLIPANDVEGDAITYSYDSTYTTDSEGVKHYQTSPELGVSVDSSTGKVTVTPKAGVSGVFQVRVMVSSSASTYNTYDYQYVAVYVNPAAPSGIQLVATFDTGSSSSDNLTNLNNSTDKKLQFEVDGVVSGALVQLYSDNTLIGQATSTGTSVVVTTNGTASLTDGTHSITATQTLQSQTVSVGNLSTTKDLASTPSTYLSVTVDTTAPTFNFTPVTEATQTVAYTCQAAATDSSGGAVTYSLTQAPPNSDMKINATSGLITWLPTTSQSGDIDVVVRATDTAGNTADRHFTVATTAINIAPVLTAASPLIGTTNEDTSIVVALSAFIDNGDGTTQITDADTDAVVGGLALFGLTGNGAWAYSLDGGSTFVTIDSASSHAALLLPKDAELRYTPDGKNGELPTISYRAWDTTTGTSGTRVDLSTDNATGGTTAFSTASDTASLDVTDVNDAPTLSAAHPFLGGTTHDVAKIIALKETFINNGSETTTIADVDTNATIGGIAMTGATGSGTWEYSLDGTTYTPVGTVADDSALLLPSTAKLRYTPVESSTANETATITYRAWDATSGAVGSKVDATTTGDETAFSALADTASLLVNTAPVLTPAAPTLGTTDEDTAATIALVDTFVNHGDGTTTIADADADAAVGGIAVIGATGNGTWAYSLDGTTFTDVGTVGPSAALLLPSTAKLRYTPDAENGETAAITYRAWDATTGTAGDKVDLVEDGVGGSTAFSSASDVASLTVTSVNDAPVLSPVLTATNPSLGIVGSTTATTISLTGTFINNGDGTTTITDVDNGAVIGGIALTGTTGNGTWAYSLDGTTFSAVGPVSTAAALLLPNTATLRYTPIAGESETATISYLAWDTTTGTAGSRVSLAATGVTGGTTAFSTASDTASLVVNTAPVLTAVAPSLGTTDEDTAASIGLSATFINNGTDTTTITDADSNATVGGIAVVGITGHGTWAYSLDGTTYTSMGTVSASSAILLPKNAMLRYTPDAANGETATITYRAWDMTTGTAGGRVDLSGSSATGGATAFSTVSDTASLTVTSVNDAPTIVAGAPSLGSTVASTAKTVSLSDFINVTSGTTIADVDQDAIVGGIAVTGLTGSGTWAYSLDGTTFTNIGTVSATSALLLPSSAKLRYTPNAATAETATITYRAWDTTSGTSGAKVDVSTNGGTTAFSTVADTASLTVTNPNTAPVLTAANPSLGATSPTTAKTIALNTFINANSGTTITDSDTDATVGGIAVVGTTGSGTWAYSLDGTTYTSIGTVSTTAALLLPKAASLRYTPDGSSAETATIVYRAWDTTSGTSGNKVDVTTNGGATAFSALTDTASLTVAAGSLSGYVYIDANNDGLRTTSSGKTHLGIQGVAVTLLSKSSTGTWTTAATTMTDANGYYTFSNLAAGTYRIAETQPTYFVDGKETLGTIGGTATGTAGADQFDVTLAAGGNGVAYNFGERGLAAGQVSLRSFLASVHASASETVAQLNAAPVVQMGSTAATAFSAATITDDGTMLAGLTATITDIKDGASETLAATTTGTSITASYASGILTLSGVDTLANYQKVLQTVAISDSATSPQTGSRTVKVVAYDGVAYSDPVTSTVTILAAAPTGYSIEVNDSTINATEAASTGFTFAGATVGDTYTYTVSSSGGTATVTGSGTVTSANQTITGIDVSSLSDGTLTYSVTLKNGDGLAGSATTATATLDKTAPSGYSVSMVDSVVNASEAASTGFTFTGAITGATYHYTVTSDGGTGSVTGSGTVTSSTQTVSGIDVSSLSDGTLTYSVSLSDGAGNYGAYVAAIATLDKTAPTGYSITLGSSTVTSTNAASTSFTFAGALVGATYHYTVSSSGGTATVTGSGTVTSATQQITGINVSSLADGTLNYSVSLTDAAGNAGSAVTATASLEQETASIDAALASTDDWLE